MSLHAFLLCPSRLLAFHPHPKLLPDPCCRAAWETVWYRTPTMSRSAGFRSVFSSLRSLQTAQINVRYAGQCKLTSTATWPCRRYLSSLNTIRPSPGPTLNGIIQRLPNYAFESTLGLIHLFVRYTQVAAAGWGAIKHTGVFNPTSPFLISCHSFLSGCKLWQQFGVVGQSLWMPRAAKAIVLFPISSRYRFFTHYTEP